MLNICRRLRTRCSRSRRNSEELFFDDIPGHPRGHRILANLLTSIRRINITLGLAADASPIELVHYWRRYMKEAKVIPPATVKTGPLMENVYTGKDIDIFKIPVPRWHEHDGGYYIGTGDMVIMRDPDTGWINYGAYRVQAQEAGVATVMFSTAGAHPAASASTTPSDPAVTSTGASAWQRLRLMDPFPISPESTAPSPSSREAV